MTMRFATYNIWNEPDNLAARYPLLAREITMADADIIGLQEVAPDIFERLRADLPYAHSHYMRYPGRDEGLAVFSKQAFLSSHDLAADEAFACSAAQHVLIEQCGTRVSVTNLHLPWASILIKERQIVEINRFIAGQKGQADEFVLLGDFNCGLVSSIHGFLIGEQSLLGAETKPSWADLASGWAARTGEENRPTLDFHQNPRWRGRAMTYIPAVVDHIYMIDSFTSRCCDGLRHAGLFGTAVDDQTGWAASDHYGVLAEVAIEKTGAEE